MNIARYRIWYPFRCVASWALSFPVTHSLNIPSPAAALRWLF